MNETRRRLTQAHARSAVYRYLSTLFVHPDPVAWAALQEASGADVKRVFSLLGWGAEEFMRLLEGLHGMTREQLEEEYVAIFGHTAAGELPPYEARYDARHVFQETHCLADVAGFYRAFGLEPSEAQRERPDHIAVELEFMHVVALKEAYALIRRWTEQADLCRRAESDFLRDHLGRWAPSFLKRLGNRAGGGIFERIAGVTAAFLEAHCRHAGISLEASDLEPAPAPAEPEGADFSCAASCPAGMAQPAPSGKGSS